VTAGWIKLHNEELHDLNWQSIVFKSGGSREMRWAVHVARWGQNRNARQGFGGRT
jgi:hypothetical protein